MKVDKIYGDLQRFSLRRGDQKRMKAGKTPGGGGDLQIRSIYDTDIEPGRISGKKKKKEVSLHFYNMLLYYDFHFSISRERTPHAPL